jgi:2-amino-4-hydroxy-6-hydroxymethyldihydropteridine diphosphokinase
VIKENGLTIPHPEMSKRRFVLEPLNEIIPAYIHPVYYKTITELLDQCDDTLPVKKIT